MVFPYNFHDIGHIKSSLDITYTISIYNHSS